MRFNGTARTGAGRQRFNPPPRLERWRAWFTLGGLILLFCILLGRAIWLQGFNEGFLQEQGEAEPAAAAEEVAIEIRGYVDLLSLNIKGSEVLSDALAEQGAEGDEIPCGLHILVDTEEVSDEVFARLEDGGDFAGLAAEFTTDPSGVSNGGDLGCSPADRYVPELMDAVNGAEIGVPVQVQTDSGYHILEVTAIEVDNSAAVGDAISAVFDSAMVEVDPLVGTWDAASGTIIPAN